MHKVLATALALVLPSCASIVSGGPDHVPVSSEPAGATIVMNGAQVGRTPVTLPLPRHAKPILLRLELEGHHPQEVEVDIKSNWWVVGNGLFGLVGIVGIVIDVASGNAWFHDDRPVHVAMTPASQPSPGLRWQRTTSRPSSSASSSSSPTQPKSRMDIYDFP